MKKSGYKCCKSPPSSILLHPLLPHNVFDSPTVDGIADFTSRAAVTTSILAPAGPQRSRTLATLNRDERVQSHLQPHLSGMLRKMLLEYIVRPEEVKEFEAGLEEHQRAKVEGGGTVLERAVREHNVGACGKVSRRQLYLMRK